MTPMQKILLIVGFLVTGSINTLTEKWQFQSCGPTHHDFDHIVNKDCNHDGWKHFHKPWTQNLQMFIGEALVIFIFLARRPGAQARELNQEAKKVVPFYIFLLPACCDILGTGVGGVGMLFISAPVWQMMRGSLMVFTAIFSVVFLGRELPPYKWAAVVVCVIGLALIGVSAILDAAGSESSSVPLGILFTVVSQAFAAFQMVVEEIYVKKYEAPPAQVVGSEGIWGIIVMTIVLSVMYLIPGNDGGSYENALESFGMLAGSRDLLIFVMFYLCSISFFNFFGVTISGQLSAVHRTLNDALRTIIIWVVEIIVFYTISEEFGVGWKAHTYLQLIGFALLVLGNLLQNAIVKIPGFKYEDDRAAATGQRLTESTTGTSMPLVDDPEIPVPQSQRRQ
eukprot:TRINITY_DN94603_c0_g1_i1.p1 TRINITY_DN94603_c0_g1~~TRINITY_DN94603_c0_g1_i1.p1  ORF type:complete len:395 (-),score=53.40 TRINITY_DN94603_c0_g1_i1:13-1197(-)